MIVNKLGNIYRNNNSGGNYAGNVYDSEGLCPALTCDGGGGNREPMIVSSRGRDPNNPSDRSSKNLEQRLEVQQEGLTNTLTSVQKDNYVLEDYSLRKLTPKEYFRLMGVHDEDYEKLTVSNTQKYNQAGNSIVVNVLMAIFENMFIKECKEGRLF